MLALDAGLDVHRMHTEFCNHSLFLIFKFNVQFLSIGSTFSSNQFWSNLIDVIRTAA